MKSQFHLDDPWTGPDPADANSLRFTEFVRLLRLQETWLWIGGPAGALVLLGLMTKPLAALVLPLIAIAVGLGVVFWIADRNAADSFWEVYARTRGLSLGGRTRLPESTPLLRAGNVGYTTRTLDGQIAPGLFGTLALYTYEEETVGLNGQRETAYHEFTIATVEVPECAPYIGELYGLARRGQHPLDEFGDGFRRGRRRVRLESEALDRRLEILVGEGQDEVWTRGSSRPPSSSGWRRSRRGSSPSSWSTARWSPTFPATRKTRRTSTRSRWRRGRSRGGCSRSRRRLHRERARLAA